jgi:hypothetical protein
MIEGDLSGDAIVASVREKGQSPAHPTRDPLPYPYGAFTISGSARIPSSSCHRA